MDRRIQALAVAIASVIACVPLQATAAAPRPIVFVHGLGGNAAEIGVGVNGAPPAFGDLLQALARAHPLPGVCPDGFQTGRPWDGSPCVYRYVEDLAEATEPAPASQGPNDSQSGVVENADKLAAGVAALVQRTGGRRAILIGYSMGGAIIRTYLALHRDDAIRDVKAVVLIDSVAEGSWGFSLISSVTQRADGPVRRRVMELMRTMAATTSSVNIDRPAENDLRPRSDLYRTITAVQPPSSISYYTFWGDIRLTIARRMLIYDLPDFQMPSLGDLGLLPGEPAPDALPELGGQRFTPTVLDPGAEARDDPHTTTIRLSGETVRALLDRCGSAANAASCRKVLGTSFNVPNTHTAIPFALSHVKVDDPLLGGQVTILDAVLAAVDRNGGGR